MLKVGWTVERQTSERLRNEAAVPVLVHSCSDEKTLTAAAGHVVQGANGKLSARLPRLRSTFFCPSGCVFHLIFVFKASDFRRS